MDPQDLAERIWDRALKADHVEWGIMQDLLRAMAFEHRIQCWQFLSQKCRGLFPDPVAAKTMKAIHPHVVDLILEVFRGPPSPALRETLDRLEAAHRQAG